MSTYSEVVSRRKFPHLEVVEASAGSGKTEALARRYVWIVLAGESRVPHSDISNLLAITFTRKAAREMKERVLDLLKKLALRKDGDFFEKTMEQLGMEPDELEAAAAAAIEKILDRYSDFQIQTIDSFMYSVARSAALDLDLDPDFEITETYSQIMTSSMTLLLRQVGPQRDPEVTHLMDEFMSLLNQVGDSSFKWNPDKEMERIFGAFLETEAKETGDLVFEDRGRGIQKCCDEISHAQEKIARLGLPLDTEYLEKFNKELRQLSAQSLFKRSYTSRTLPVVRKNLPGSLKGLCEDAGRDWLYVGQCIGDLAEHVSLNRYKPYGDVYGEFKRFMNLVKMREGVLHIDDMRKTLNSYMREDIVPDLYVRLGQRLYHFMIDEFQDTDPVQWASLYQLLTESLAQGGTLFLVGDLKQAIYMFRNADYRVMRDLIRDVERKSSPPVWLPPSVSENCWVKKLETNHRSDGVIVEYVDQVFKNKLKTLVEEGEIKEDLTGLTDFVQLPLPEREGKGYVRTILFESQHGRMADSDPPPERQVLLDILADLRSRNYSYGDIAVLAGTNAELATMAGWLVAADIPTSASSSLDIRNRKVVAEIIQLLMFLDSPVDDLAFANFVMGDVVSAFAESRRLPFDRNRIRRLILDARSGGQPPQYLYQALRTDGDFAGLWEECFEGLYQKTGYYPLYDLACMALETFRVFENFRQETGSLVKLLEVVNDLESEGRSDIGEFLERAASEEADLFALELPEYADAVRLMTFHKVKGLGFGAVINMIGEPRVSHDSLCYDKKGDRIRVHYITKPMAEKNGELARIYDRDKADAQIQYLNSLYVVCTRPRRELYNLVFFKKNSFTARLFEECEMGKKLELEAGSEAPPPPPTRVSLPRTGIEGETRGESGRWSYARWLDALKGEAMHEVLGEIEYLSSSTGEEIRQAAERCLLSRGKSFDASLIASLIESFVARALVRRWFERVPGRLVLRESDFVDEHGDLRRMDRVVIDTDRVAVIDFKTGEPEEYGGQMKSYMHILRQIYPERSISGYVAYIETGDIQEVR